VPEEYKTCLTRAVLLFYSFESRFSKMKSQE